MKMHILMVRGKYSSSEELKEGASSYPLPYFPALPTSLLYEPWERWESLDEQLIENLDLRRRELWKIQVDKVTAYLPVHKKVI